MDEFGIYVHVPFCRARCDYCAFATYVDRDHLMDRYAAACIRELQMRREAAEVTGATSVFFGGGTPSRLPTEALCAVLDEVALAPGAEVTVECNPEDATTERLAAYRAQGVTRLSFGVQSTHDHVLESLGRHTVPDAAARVTEAATDAGFDTFNLDLIFGAAAETDDDWARTLDAVLSLPHPPPHVSAYALTVEPGTPLALDRRRHPDEDRLARRYEMTERMLGDAGYAWEEISNWARPGHECRHNGLYWAQGDYAGIGSAAHSHAAGRRWWNVRTPDRYVDAVEAGRPVTAGEEELTDHQREFERLALLLRTRHGVPADALPDAPELDGLVERRVERHVERHAERHVERHGERDDERAVLTVRGRLLANEVTTHLVVVG